MTNHIRSTQTDTQGINALHEATQHRIQHNMAAFEEFAKLYAFYVPQGLVPAPTPDASTATADADAVQAALAKLVATRRALIAVRLVYDYYSVCVGHTSYILSQTTFLQTKTQNARLQQRIGMLQAELSTHSSVPAPVQHVLDILAAKENVGEELALAGAVARKLAPRLVTAQQVVLQGHDTAAQGQPDKEVFRRQATRPPLTVQQLDQLAKQLTT